MDRPATWCPDEVDVTDCVRSKVVSAKVSGPVLVTIPSATDGKDKLALPLIHNGSNSSRSCKEKIDECMHSTDFLHFDAK